MEAKKREREEIFTKKTVENHFAKVKKNACSFPFHQPLLSWTDEEDVLEKCCRRSATFEEKVLVSDQPINEGKYGQYYM
jgi:hypothetical protein